MKRSVPLALVILACSATLSLATTARNEQHTPDRAAKRKTESRADAAARKREEAAAKKRTDADHDRDRAVQRQKQDDRKRQDSSRRREDRAPNPTRVVFIGGYLYDPFFDPQPWWPRTLYPYRWSPRFDGRAHVRILASPKHAAVYVDGYYAGVVDDFDGVFQPLPLLPGGHTIALYLDGYRTVNRRVYLTPGATLKLHDTMEPLPPSMASAPPSVAPSLPSPPEGTYLPLRTPPLGSLPTSNTTADAGFGMLSIQIRPLSATLTIDGEEWLTTKPGEIVVHLGAGRHVVVVSAPDRPAFTTEVQIREGETTDLNVRVPERPTT